MRDGAHHLSAKTDERRHTLTVRGQMIGAYQCQIIRVAHVVKSGSLFR